LQSKDVCVATQLFIIAIGACALGSTLQMLTQMLRYFVSFQQSIFGIETLITRGCMVWWFGISPWLSFNDVRKEVIP
jgi:hypothetical protein